MSPERVLKPASNIYLGNSSHASDASSLPVWERLSTWASENKAIVYTIAGVAVVVSGAGVVYYLSESRKGTQSVGGEEKKRLSKKERRKAKQDKDKEKSQADARTTSEQPEEACKLWLEPSVLVRCSPPSSASANSRVRSSGKYTTDRRVHC